MYRKNKRFTMIILHKRDTTTKVNINAIVRIHNRCMQGYKTESKSETGL